jgi:hypothetical protein
MLEGRSGAEIQERRGIERSRDQGIEWRNNRSQKSDIRRQNAEVKAKGREGVSGGQGTMQKSESRRKNAEVEAKGRKGEREKGIEWRSNRSQKADVR